MSDAPHVPFMETKAPESAERLHQGALGLIDIAASTMANIGPAYSFMFGFGLLVITAGIAAPLTVVAAVIAIALLGNTLSQFARAALGVIVVSLIYAMILVRRDPGVGERVGSIVADE